MNKTKKTLATLAIAGMTLSMLPFNVFAAGTVPQRLSGITAAETAVAIAEQTGWTGSAILASSTSYGMVDALTAGPLASFLEAPILLQEAGSVLNEATKAELIKLEVKKVYVTSGTAVISQAVLNELAEMDITVVSLGGKDRFETSVNIANKMVELGASISKVAVAYGWLNQDALSIASIASAQTQPILLTEANSLPESVEEFLAENESVIATDVIGGTAVISETVKAELPGSNRYFGNTAYDTNVAVLKAFDDVLEYDNVFLANGETAIDALAGAPLAAQFNAGIVLTKGNANEGTEYVGSKLSATSVITALGGTAVIPDSVLADLVAAQAAAVAKAAAIEKTEGIVQGEDASAVTAQDLIDAGVTATDIIAANLEAYQDAISAADESALDSTEKIQQLVTDVNAAIEAAEAKAAALVKIDGIVQDEDASTITAQDLIDAGVTATDVIAANLEAYQDAISAADDSALDSTEKIQAMVTAVNATQAAVAKAAAIEKIDGIVQDEDASDVTAQDLIDAGVTATDVIAANLEAYQDAISAADDSALDSTEKIQAMVTTVNETVAAEEAAVIKAAAILKIDGIVLDADASSVTAQDLIDAGVVADDVIPANLEAYQDAVSAAADSTLDSTEKIQDMVTAVNAAVTAEAEVQE
ncbi:cell wall-binding repeat-containing protein [Desulfosporosinus nitroreducens]|uniref:cell wall-binding repeat-containing protein n=1 Tax=Desulfosporosinus nitroreducens TaxID=2018668 RepID=UPI00207D6E62|nr:cell wall-binding repeat-containing protein [Desulfosporosinus nitroreducens]MCO1601028.1 cell wall-binding repeat-containing protein [Desulfosporosinus nitroreducens]